MANGIEITQTPEDEEELYEEVSALEQAMTSEEHQNEGTFLTGGNTRDFFGISEEEGTVDEHLVLNPPDVRDGPVLLDFLRGNLHKFDSPYAYIGGEANSPDKERFHDADVKILIARLSTYESVSLSMSHSLMAQIYSELPKVFCDFAFLPKPNDYRFLKENKFPVWFGANSKLAPNKFDVLSITHAVSMEQLNFVPLLHDSGIPLFKEQRMEREDIPIIIVGGANSGTTAPLAGAWTDSTGKEWSCFIDAVIYGDGEQAAQQFIECVRAGKAAGLSKREILKSCHGKVAGFYEPDAYVHEYDGKGSITNIRRKEGYEYVAFPVNRANVDNLDSVRTLETKVLPYTGDGASVDVAIAGSVGCIGSAGWGACSFCREGSEGPYRERTLPKVMEALGEATKNQGNKEVSFFSLNFNQYADLFPLVDESVKKGYKVGLISQRIDMLAETPEQIRVQRYLKKSNFTLGVEGISGRTRAYLNKNLQEWEILRVSAEMMKEGAGELKYFQIVTGLETEVDVEEFCTMMEKINALREKIGATTRFRVSFTPLFPSAFTALQFAPANAAIMHGTRSLDRLFTRAKELGWGRRLSVSGEEPLVSNTINHGGRNITPLLIDSHFKDGWRFYGNVPKGTWARWERRINENDNIDLDITWGEKSFEYIFPWEDIGYSTSKEIIWRGYMKAVAFQGITYSTDENSMVKTKRGLLKLKDVEPLRDEIWTREGWKIVKHKRLSGETSCLKITLTTGQELLVTPEHDILKCRKTVKQVANGGQETYYEDLGFTEARDLKVGDWLRVELKTDDRVQDLTIPGLSRKTDQELMYVLGYWLGDGTKANKNELHWCTSTKEAAHHQNLKKMIRRVFDTEVIEVENPKGIFRSKLNNPTVRRWFDEQNFKAEIPDWVFQAPAHDRAAFLRGLFDSDGSVSVMNGKKRTLRVTFTQKSKTVRLQVQQLLLSLGIDSVDDRVKNLRIQSRQGLIRFRDEVDFLLERKSWALNSAIAANLLPEHSGSRKIRPGEMFVQIAQVESGHTAKVGDLEVDDLHEFTANGIVVHNCLTTRTIKGVCHVNECGACDPDKDGKPNKDLIKAIVGRKVAPTISTEKIAASARSREKAYHLRVLFETNDPIYRFVLKGYFQYAIPRALMHVSEKFNDGFVGAIGHARIAAGANMAKDWTFGRNIYDFSLCEYMKESELKALIEPANKLIHEGRILDIRMDSHMTQLRNDVDYAVYTMFVPNGGINYQRISSDIDRYMEKRSVGKESIIRIKKAQGKGVFVTVEQGLKGKDVRSITYEWLPEHKGTLVRMVISANYNPMSMLEALTGRKAFSWKEYPIFCDGYVQLSKNTGEIDVLAAMMGEAQNCRETGEPLEMDIFSGKKMASGLSLTSETGLAINFPVEMMRFTTRELQAIDVREKAVA